jgi:hypothetical protein
VSSLVLPHVNEAVRCPAEVAGEMIPIAVKDATTVPAAIG